MEFIIKNNTITINSDKKEILLTSENIVLDTLPIDLPGEYEKSGCLMYAFAHNDERVYHFRTEGYWIAYVPTLMTDISVQALEFLAQVDILVMPGARSMQPTLEKIEPRLLVTYGELASEIGTLLGSIEPAVTKYKLKENDLSSEKTGVVVMG
jgi:hypothetical protein